VDQPVRLEEIDSARDVCGHNVVMPADAVHLNGEKHENIFLLELARKFQDGRAAPAMAVKDNAGILLLIAAHGVIVFRVEEVQDGFVRFLAAPVFKRLDLYIGRKRGAEVFGHFVLAANRVVAADKTSHEANDKIARGKKLRGHRALLRRGELHRRMGVLGVRRENRDDAEEKSKRRNTAKRHPKHGG
jgi:hypothetical protein